ncbi:MAG: 7-cyano-7-deazaguanine synthase, partial [Clostridia bacterium]|nr:7-cyano-7-deazaguanine synthase [Clostridia bacterium]
MDGVYEKYRMLSDALQKTDGIAVAFSGGTDSSFLLYAAKEALGEKVLAVTAASPFVPKREVQAAKAFCETYGIRHTVIPASALNIDGLRHNPPDRCYLCKRQIMGAILEEARRQGITWVAEGANADDETQYRPGTRAVKELGVLSPLKEAGLTKAEIRQLS